MGNSSSDSFSDWCTEHTTSWEASTPFGGFSGSHTDITPCPYAGSPVSSSDTSGWSIGPTDIAGFTANISSETTVTTHGTSE